MNKKPNGEVFEGRSSEMKDSPWLASEDLLDVGDVFIDAKHTHNFPLFIPQGDFTRL